MHRCTQPWFGWREANYLGASRQDNRPTESWPDFWWSRRLEPQLERALGAGLTLTADLATIRDASDRLLGHAPCPALVHGDLWGGNHAYLPNGRPAIFDPAPYFGDRETDLAMMRLFSGFHPAVFEAYAEAWPLPPGFEDRLALYQSYHLLNHYNLFGAGWGSQVARALDTVLRTAGRA
jgi:fructosamine-3-kinase